MKNFNSFTRAAIALMALCGMLAPAFAFAQTGVAATASVNAGTRASVKVKAAAAAKTPKSKACVGKIKTDMATAKTCADQEIDRRIAALNDLGTRVQAMQKVTDSFKQSIANSIQTQVSALGQLKAKIDADTDAATLKTDIQAIAQSYRVYALLLPQVRIAAQADREVVLATMLTTLGQKLQARVSSAQSAGANVSAMTAALSDMSNKLSDAGSKAQAAVSTTATLAPDNGDKTVKESNDAALKTARADLDAGTKDLQAARKDTQAVLAALKSAKPSATATTTTSTH